MKIASLKLVNFPPLKEFEIRDLGSIVIIAGANGSGKTRIKESIIQSFKNPKKPVIDICIESTRPDKEEYIWGSNTLSIHCNESNLILHQYMGTRSRGGTYTGTVVQVNSDRSVQSVQFQQINLSTPDPDDEELSSTYYLDIFSSRWTNLVNKIYSKAANRGSRVYQYVQENPSSLGQNALSEYPDPFVPYQEIFHKLLPDKELRPIDPKKPQEFQYNIVGHEEELPFITLSSGEQEVIKIAFDLIWKKIRHCVILVDEPELHLHPSLAFRLIEAIKSIGASTVKKQFVRV
jgi:AAA15 family ATPase/GTPase